MTSFSEELKNLAEHNAKLRREIEALKIERESILDQTALSFKEKDAAITLLALENRRLNGLIHEKSFEIKRLNELLEIERSWNQ